MGRLTLKHADGVRRRQRHPIQPAVRPMVIIVHPAEFYNTIIVGQDPQREPVFPVFGEQVTFLQYPAPSDPHLYTH